MILPLLDLKFDGSTIRAPCDRSTCPLIEVQDLLVNAFGRTAIDRQQVGRGVERQYRRTDIDALIIIIKDIEDSLVWVL